MPEDSQSLCRCFALAIQVTELKDQPMRSLEPGCRAFPCTEAHLNIHHARLFEDPGAMGTV